MIQADLDLDLKVRAYRSGRLLADGDAIPRSREAVSACAMYEVGRLIQLGRLVDNPIAAGTFRKAYRRGYCDHFGIQALEVS